MRRPIRIITRRLGLGLAVAVVLALLAGCATVPATPAGVEASQAEEQGPLLGIYDPWERFNRGMYVFNAEFDRYVFLPVVRGYETITPDLVQLGISNFFRNLGQIRTFANAILQLKPRTAAVSLGRFVLNVGAGLGGLFDPATDIGLARPNEDFGQTLGRYGVGGGPYVVLPIFGPSNLRDTSGLVIDGVARALLVGTLPIDDAVMWGASGLEGVDARHSEKFRYYETGSPFEYELIRFLYTTHRRLEIAR